MNHIIQYHCYDKQIVLPPHICQLTSRTRPHPPEQRPRRPSPRQCKRIEVQLDGGKDIFTALLHACMLEGGLQDATGAMNRARPKRVLENVPEDDEAGA